MCCKDCKKNTYCEACCWHGKQEKKTGDATCHNQRGCPASNGCPTDLMLDFWKYEKKVLNKLAKISAMIIDNAHLGLPVTDYIDLLSKTKGKNRMTQVQLLDKRIDKIHKEIKAARAKAAARGEL